MDAKEEPTPRKVDMHAVMASLAKQRNDLADQLAMTEGHAAALAADLAKANGEIALLKKKLDEAPPSVGSDNV